MASVINEKIHCVRWSTDWLPMEALLWEIMVISFGLLSPSKLLHFLTTPFFAAPCSGLWHVTVNCGIAAISVSHLYFVFLVIVLLSLFAWATSFAKELLFPPHLFLVDKILIIISLEWELKQYREFCYIWLGHFVVSLKLKCQCLWWLNYMGEIHCG